MTWETAASIAEVIGAIGVILSLLYVGRQLKQSNVMARSATRQEINSSLSNWAANVAASPSLAETFAKVHYHGLVRDEASDQDRIQISYAYFGFIAQQHFLYAQWKEGIITDQELDDLLGPGSAFLEAPYLRSVWPIIRVSFPEDFSEWYENRFHLRIDE